MNLFPLLATAAAFSALFYPALFYTSPLAAVSSNDDNLGGVLPLDHKSGRPTPKAETDNIDTIAVHDGIDSNHDDVLFFDEKVQQNIHATYAGANSYIEVPTLPDALFSHAQKQAQFQTLPLLATIDRRPIIVRKQLMKDTNNITQGGKLLGCAISATTFVDNLDSQAKLSSSEKEGTTTCHVCFQFSNREDASNFIPSYHQDDDDAIEQNDSMSTKCYEGSTRTPSKFFARWQQRDFPGYGYPYTVNCVLPNGYPELTCRAISDMTSEIDTRDDIQRIYFKTEFMLSGKFGNRAESNKFYVHSTWPWEALMSHDDDRSKIAKGISMTWNDTASDYVPENASELKLAHAEGPGYQKKLYNGNETLQSMQLLHPNSTRGGIHPRLLVNLYHFIRNSPGTTHMIGVVDGQANRSLEYIRDVLDRAIADVFPRHWKMLGSMEELTSMELITSSENNTARSNDSKGLTTILQTPIPSTMTLREILRLRQIKLHLFPFLIPSLVLEKSVCGGQYVFMSYLAARYAADYHVMMYLDGDTALLSKHNTLREVMYNRFFFDQSGSDEERLQQPKCAGHRIQMVDQYVPSEMNEKLADVVQCSHGIETSPDQWRYVMNNCNLAAGHIVARTDSIYQFKVHWPETLDGYLPDGVEDCKQEDERWLLNEDEVIQVHLRDRMRKEECTCLKSAAVQ